MEGRSEVCLAGILRPTSVQDRSHRNPSAPFRRVRECAPSRAASDGRKYMAPADPRYIPDVVMDTAFALSAAGMACDREV
jgi:hypothetical protein